MEPEDTSPNVRPLFPGIDTTPFGGRSSSRPETGDDGWSAVPERTITTVEQPLADAIRGSTASKQHLAEVLVGLPRRLVATSTLLWIGIALSAGVAFAVATALTAQPVRRHRLLASRPSHAIETRPALDREEATIKPRVGQVRHATKPTTRHPTHRVSRREQVHAPPPTLTVYVATAPQENVPAVSTGTGSGTDYARSASVVSTLHSSTRTPLPGPAGPGYVIGSNCDPKCH